MQVTKGNARCKRHWFWVLQALAQKTVRYRQVSIWPWQGLNGTSLKLSQTETTIFHSRVTPHWTKCSAIVAQTGLTFLCLGAALLAQRYWLLIPTTDAALDCNLLSITSWRHRAAPWRRHHMHEGGGSLKFDDRLYGVAQLSTAKHAGTQGWPARLQLGCGGANCQTACIHVPCTLTCSCPCARC